MPACHARDRVPGRTSRWSTHHLIVNSLTSDLLRHWPPVQTSLSILCTDVALCFGSTCCSALPGGRMHLQKSPGRSRLACSSKTLQCRSLQIDKGCVRACFVHANTHACASTLMHARKRACVGARICKYRKYASVLGLPFRPVHRHHCREN
jgi:hypothetical protein